MEKEFVPYQPSLELKELGFDEPCIAYYENNGKNSLLVTDSVNFTNTDLKVEGISSPLYQQAFRWFREKYQIDSCIHRNGGMNIDERGFLPYYEIIIRHKSPELKCVKYSYEEAELECLKKLIEITQNTNK